MLTRTAIALCLAAVGLWTTLVAVAVGTLAMATQAPLGLVFAARRSTLREVSAGLAAVSRQFDERRVDGLAGRSRCDPPA